MNSFTCRHCGGTHKEGALFCSKTGKSLVDEPCTVEPPTHPAALLPPPPDGPPGTAGKARQPTIIMKPDGLSFTQPIKAGAPVARPPGNFPAAANKASSGKGKCPLCGGYHARKAKFCPVKGKEIFRTVCPICGEEILLKKPDAKFCPLCGGNMIALCPYKECKTPLPAHAPFCKSCQQKILHCLYCRSTNPLGTEHCLNCNTPMPPVPGEWLTFKGNNGRTGFSQEKLDFPLYIKWSFPDREKASRFTASPLVWNGTVYIGDHDGILYALNQYNGAQKWSRPVRSPILATPAIEGGCLFLPSMEGKIYAIEGLTGKIRWVYPKEKGEQPEPVDASPIVHKGRLYLSTRAGTMIALDTSTGKLIWSFKGEKTTEKESYSDTSPCLIDNLLLFTQPLGLMYGLSADTGKELWRFPKEGRLKAQISGTPSIAEGLIYLGDRSGNLFSLKKETGEDTWHNSTQVEGGVNSSMSAGLGALFAGTWAQYFYSLDMYAGGIRWRHRNEKITVWDSITSPSLVLDQGAVVYGSSSGYIYALDMEGKEVWSYRLDKEINAPPVASDGFLYVGCTDGVLYAFYPR